MTSDRREGDGRDACEIAANVRFEHDCVVLPCVVTDISEQGARLAFESDLMLPRFFQLALPLIEGRDDIRRVELRWREGRHAGVRFAL